MRSLILCKLTHLSKIIHRMKKKKNRVDRKFGTLYNDINLFQKCGHNRILRLRCAIQSVTGTAKAVQCHGFGERCRRRRRPVCIEADLVWQNKICPTVAWYAERFLKTICIVQSLTLCIDMRPFVQPARIRAGCFSIVCSKSGGMRHDETSSIRRIFEGRTVA